MNVKKKIIGFLLAASTAVSALALPAAAAPASSISGKVTSYGSTRQNVTLSLFSQGSSQIVDSVTVSGDTYSFDGVADGTYVLRAEKYSHVTREYTVDVQGSVTQDVKLCIRGDVTGDGRINMGDTAKVFSHVRKSKIMTDEYAIACADMTQDGKLNIGDVGRVFAVVRNPALLDPVDPVDPVIPPIPSNPVEDYKDEPIEVGSTLEFDVPVAGGHLVYYHLYRVSGTTLEIHNPYAYVIYEGKTYEAKDGVVTVPDLFSSNTNVPVQLAIGNRATMDQTFAVKLLYPAGHQMNPIPLSVGMMTTECEEDNDQGVYYLFTATQTGNLTIRLRSDVDCNITVTSQNESGGTRSVALSDNPGSTSLTFAMAEGESALVCIVMNPVNGFNYPAGTVSTMVRYI